MKSKDLAALAAQKYSGISGDKEAALDLATISSFLAMILELVSTFKNCKSTPAQAAKVSNSPNVFQRVTLRRVVRDTLGDDFRNHGQEVISALLETGNTLKETDFVSLYKEV